jgi:uracil phosphoribosyltransferase
MLSPTARPFPNVVVSNHPVLLHKLSIIRDKSTSHPVFRQLLRELSFYLG